MIFLSYSRSDDEAFVKRLYTDLTARGIDIWWDRVSMPSRALTFLQEIRDAVAGAGRVLLVVGRGALESNYVRAEWQYALEACLHVLPVLRVGDYDLLSPELARLHCVDMRATRDYGDALAELVDKLAQAVPPPGVLRGNIPALPMQFLLRPEYITELEGKLLSDINRPLVITSVQRTAALQGMGGVGKTVMAAAFARLCPVRRAFLDGVIWITLGRHPDMLSAMRAVGLGFDDKPEHYLDETSARMHVTQVLSEKVCLVVLDDVWDVRHAEVFANALGPRCRLLLTTRDGKLASSLGADEQHLGLLSDQAAVQLMADWAGRPVAGLPQAAWEVAKECGNLPLALAMAGAMMQSKSASWERVLDRLRSADLAKIRYQFPNYPYPDLFRTIQVSVDTLNDPELQTVYPNLRQRYVDLAVFEDTLIPEAALRTFWGTEGWGAADTEDVIDLFEQRSLARRDGQGRITLHDLQRDYVRKQVGELAPLHKRLLEAYKRQCTGAWASGPNDGYFFQRLAAHLAKAGRAAELRDLLFNYNWLSAKLRATDVNSLLTDYRQLGGDTRVQPLERTLRQAAHVLAQSPDQLPAQLWARVPENRGSDFQELLRTASAVASSSWLRPVAATLAGSSGPLLQTLAGHAGPVDAVAVTPDGQRVISSSVCGTLKVWMLDSGEELHTLTGHSKGVRAIAVTPDSRQAISASEDGTLKIWDLASGKELRTLAGHDSPLQAVAMAPDGQAVISASAKTFTVWDMGSGSPQRSIPITGHTFKITAVAIMPGGQRGLTGSRDGTVMVWDLDKGSVKTRMRVALPSERDPRRNDLWSWVTGFAIPRDGDRAIVASGYGDIRVWDLKTGKLVQSLTRRSLHSGIIVTPDGMRALSFSSPTMITTLWDSPIQRVIKVWDLEDGRELFALQGHSGTVNSVAVTPNGQFAISTSSDGTLKVWDLQRGGQDTQGVGHGNPIEAVAVTRDGRLALSASGDGVVKVWDVERGQLRCTLALPLRLSAAAMAPDGKHVIGAYSDGTIRVWDVDTREVVRTIKPSAASWINALAVTPDGQLAIGVDSEADAIRVWEMDGGTEVQTANLALKQKGGLRSDRAVSMVMAPDGRLVIAWRYNGLPVWDVSAAGSTVPIISRPHPGTFKTEGMIYWEEGFTDYSVKTKKVEHVSTHIPFVAVVPGGRRMIAASNDGMMRIVHEGDKEVCSVQAHSAQVEAAAVTPDGQRMVTASADRTVKLWDLETDELVASFSGDGAFTTCAISANGRTVVAGDRDGRVHLLRLEGAGSSPQTRAAEQRSTPTKSRGPQKRQKKPQ
jgi:WD40 repeat protein